MSREVGHLDILGEARFDLREPGQTVLRQPRKTHGYMRSSSPPMRSTLQAASTERRLKSSPMITTHPPQNQCAPSSEGR